MKSKLLTLSSSSLSSRKHPECHGSPEMLAGMFNSVCVDYGKMTAALLILAIHTAPFVSFSKVGNSIFICLFGRLAVPFFFAISGFFFGCKIWETAKQTERWKHLGRFTLRILQLWGTWNLLYLLTFSVVNGKLPESLTATAGWWLLFPGINPILWFLPAIIVAAIYVMIFQRFGTGPLGLASLFAFILLIACNIGVQNIFMGVPLFAFGAILATQKSKMECPSQRTSIVILLICILADAFAWWAPLTGIGIHFLFTACSGGIITWLLLNTSRSFSVRHTLLAKRVLRPLSIYIFVDQAIVIILFQHYLSEFITNSFLKYLIILAGCLIIGAVGIILTTFWKNAFYLQPFRCRIHHKCKM